MFSCINGVAVGDEIEEGGSAVPGRGRGRSRARPRGAAPGRRGPGAAPAGASFNHK